MSDLGKLTYYLGIEVHQFESCIAQRKNRYALKILEESGMGECNLTHILMDFNVKLSKSSKEKAIDEREREREREYTKRIGCLRC